MGLSLALGIGIKFQLKDDQGNLVKVPECNSASTFVLYYTQLEGVLVPEDRVLGATTER